VSPIDLGPGQSYALVITRRPDGTIVETWFPDVVLVATPMVVPGAVWEDMDATIVDPDRIDHWSIDGIARSNGSGYAMAQRILDADDRRTLATHVSHYRSPFWSNNQ